MGKGKQGWRAESRNKSGVVGKDRGGSGESQLAVLATAGRAATLGPPLASQITRKSEIPGTPFKGALHWVLHPGGFSPLPTQTLLHPQRASTSLYWNLRHTPCSLLLLSMLFQPLTAFLPPQLHFITYQSFLNHQRPSLTQGKNYLETSVILSFYFFPYDTRR